ncbi:hypothetical protein [Aquimarina sp. SS2-1]|uniref:hypothetical protein n=1 Tax=Aquimarina besae TaxID=3342247 RepID=UPI0036724FB6
MKGKLSINNVFSAEEKKYLLSIKLIEGVLSINDFILYNDKRVFKIVDIELHSLNNDGSAILKVKDLSDDLVIPWDSIKEFYFESDKVMD